MARRPAPTKAPAGTPAITDEIRKVADLVADPRNAKKHPESQIAQISASIEQFGFIHRVIIRPNNQIIAGHGTLESLKRLGREDVEVRVVDGLLETQYQKLALALNKLPENSPWDYDILAEIAGELNESGDTLQDIGFSPSEINKLLAEPEELEVKEIETSEVDDEFWISLRGPLKHQAHVLKALREVMKPYDGVTVEQGTINLN